MQLSTHASCVCSGTWDWISSVERSGSMPAAMYCAAVTRVRSEAIQYRRFLAPQRIALERLAQTPGEAVDRPTLVQGAVEGSNVRPILEMTRMTEELREFQFTAQFAEREDERIRNALDRILKKR